MAVKTIWLTDICGRSEGRGMLATHAECVRSLTSGDGACCGCAAPADAGDPLSNRRWRERKLAEEADAIAKSEQRVGMPPMDGSTTALAWRRRVRHATVTGAYDTPVAGDSMDDEEGVAAIDNRPWPITWALWRIAHRDAALDEVVEVSEPAPGMAAVTTEYQFA